MVTTIQIYLLPHFNVHLNRNLFKLTNTIDELQIRCKGEKKNQKIYSHCNIVNRLQCKICTHTQTKMEKATVLECFHIYIFVTRVYSFIQFNRKSSLLFTLNDTIFLCILFFISFFFYFVIWCVCARLVENLIK